jgi:hypothetical protein
MRTGVVDISRFTANLSPAVGARSERMRTGVVDISRFTANLSPALSGALRMDANGSRRHIALHGEPLTGAAGARSDGCERESPTYRGSR